MDDSDDEDTEDTEDIAPQSPSVESRLNGQAMTTVIPEEPYMNKVIFNTIAVAMATPTVKTGETPNASGQPTPAAVTVANPIVMHPDSSDDRVPAAVTETSHTYIERIIKLTTSVAMPTVTPQLISTVSPLPASTLPVQILHRPAAPHFVHVPKATATYTITEGSSESVEPVSTSISIAVPTEQKVLGMADVSTAPHHMSIQVSCILLY